MTMDEWVSVLSQRKNSFGKRPDGEQSVKSNLLQ